MVSNSRNKNRRKRPIFDPNPVLLENLRSIVLLWLLFFNLQPATAAAQHFLPPMNAVQTPACLESRFVNAKVRFSPHQEKGDQTSILDLKLPSRRPDRKRAHHYCSFTTDHVQSLLGRISLGRGSFIYGTFTQGG